MGGNTEEVKGEVRSKTLYDLITLDFQLNGGLAQLARALDLHSRGQGFDSLILHKLGNNQINESGEDKIF